MVRRRPPSSPSDHNRLAWFLYGAICSAVVALGLLGLCLRHPAPKPAAAVVVSAMPASPALAGNDIAAGPAAPSLQELPQGARESERKLPSIALIIDDLGYSAATATRASALPAAVSLAFIPTGPDVPIEVRAAEAAGHEVLLHMPMEPLGAAGSMPLMLKVGQSQAEISRLVDAALEDVPGAIAINNHMGSLFTSDRAAMTRFAQALEGRRLIFVDSRTSAATVAAEVMRRAGFETAERKVFLDDDEPDEAVVLAQLHRAEALAKRDGSIVAIGHPHEATLAAIDAWLGALPADGVELVSISEHVRRTALPTLLAQTAAAAEPPAAAEPSISESALRF